MAGTVCVELGFVEKSPKWKLKSKYFPSKVGGFPAWLELHNLPSSDELLCKVCKKPLVFLCQVYAPFTDKEHCFHRTMFVFVCRDGSCSKENDCSNIKVFRSQLSRDNNSYPFEAPKEEESGCESPGAADFHNLCRICGALGPKVCGGCKKAWYCSREHQAIDWRGGHKKECKESDTVQNFTAKEGSFLFPEFEIEMEPEELENEPNPSEEQIMKDYEDLLRTGNANNSSYDPEDEADLIKMATKETDKQFRKFRTRINQYPDQIIRYDRGGEPLWVSSDNKPKDIPQCPLCGEQKQFEFQIMPQLLVHLKADSTGRSIDWGTVLVYSCSQSCQQDKGYVEESVYKQDYTPVTDVMNSPSYVKRFK
ncbi:zinc finger protein RP-8 [Oratosquilla oratoria]|uniref:zinc finger protein RP-8 n=1 Tax=Oratosquilla oratoria TaxID=337810 RepID=UPI003F7658A1